MKDFIQLLQKIKKEIEPQFQKGASQHQLIVIKNQIIGKNAPLIKKFNSLNKTAKTQLSQKLQEFKNTTVNLYQKYLQSIQQKVEQIKINDNFTKLHSDLIADSYYSSLTSKNANFNLSIGESHPLTTIIEQIHLFCQKMNWKFIPSYDLVSFEENFGLLNIDSNHPAIGINDCFIVDLQNVLNTEKNQKQEKQLNNQEKVKWVLRTHSTNMTAKELTKYAHDKKHRLVYTIGNVYRNDTSDNTHLKQFTQFDVCLIKPNLSMANLKWILVQFCEFIFGKKIPIQFRNTFFPFTEVSIEVDVACLFCKQQGCDICHETGWVELLGSGIINSTVLDKCQIKEKITVLAIGVGVERIAMLKHQIKDIRLLYQNNLKWE